MTDPMTRIADALDVLALDKLGDYVRSIDSVGETHRATAHAINALRTRIEARHSAPAPVASEPQTVDVLGSELRVGDVIEGEDDARGVVGLNYIPQRVSDPRMHRRNGTYRVRLPRPAAEPSAKAKCPTCRCKIVPGTECACCESTSGDDPPLPRVDADVEPSASGEGIARLRHTLLEIGAHSWAVGELHDQPWLMASRIVSAINAAHAHATRELRERSERAERERDEARAAFNGVADERDRAKLERDELQAAKERLVKACECVSCRGSILPPMQCAACIEHAAPCPPGMPARPITTALREQLATAKLDRDAAIARAKAAERVVTLARRIASGEFGAAPNAVRAFVDTLDAYDAARKDGAR